MRKATQWRNSPRMTLVKIIALNVYKMPYALFCLAIALLDLVIVGLVWLTTLLIVRFYK